jgi:hypothetical protein
MKKVIPYLLLAIMGFNLVGYFTVFKIQQWSHRATMAKSEAPLDVIKVPLSYFKTHTEHGGNEIRWQGCMYDIKSVSIIDGYAVVSAINDTRENSLIEGLADYLKSHDDASKTTSKSFAKILKLDFVLATINVNISAAYNTLVFADFISAIHDGFTGHIAPPPRYC